MQSIISVMINMNESKLNAKVKQNYRVTLNRKKIKVRVTGKGRSYKVHSHARYRVFTD